MQYPRIPGVLPSSFCLVRFLEDHHIEIGANCISNCSQAVPSLRVATPSAHAAGQRHRDSGYGHQPGQVNYWLPLSLARGSNTLWVEGLLTPGVAEPLTGDFGIFHRFFGHELYHYTLPNDTETTRVSLDFRVVPGPEFDNDWPGSRARNGQQAFFVGGYYALARRHADGVWRTDEVDGKELLRGNARRAALERDG